MLSGDVRPLTLPSPPFPHENRRIRPATGAGRPAFMAGRLLAEGERVRVRGILVALLFAFVSTCFAQQSPPLPDDELLETIQRKAFDYFLAESNPENGLVRDRAHNFQQDAKEFPASIAATGFALTAYPVGVEHRWIDRGSALEWTRRTLQFFLERAPHEHGFFYHFLRMDTGERTMRSEVSPIDTALFLAGALFAAEYYEDPRIRDLAVKIYERVEWPWMLHGAETLALEWSPENGFSKGRWDHYNESMILYLLAIGSPAHPIPASSWHAIVRPAGSYKEYRLIQMPPLFTHQYSHIWVDFRDRHDAYADYFKNSVNAALANRAFCIDQSSRFSTYGPDSWGLTASDGPFGYRAYGAPPGWADHDGTIAPTGCGSSIVFTPKESLACLRHFYETYGEKLWGLYGFSDAFNLDKNWFAADVIAIDQGALLLMIENYRSGLIWETMSRNLYLQNAMKDAGFKPGTMEIAWPDPPVYRAPYIFGGIQVDGYLKDWPNAEVLKLDRSFKENGNFKDDSDLQAEIRLAWDEKALYFAARVTDDEVRVRKTGKNIWQDDLVEIYVDPGGDGLYWYDKSDFQLGFRPRLEDEGVETWSWFQGGEDPAARGAVSSRGYVHSKGYILEGSIRWDYLGIDPQPGETVRMSVAPHDVDRDGSGGKFQWFFRNEEEFKRFVLGKVVLEK